MSAVALEHDRQSRADRLLQEIAARHGLAPVTRIESTDPDGMDRFLAAHVHDGDVPTAEHAVEFGFAASMRDALALIARMGQDEAGSAAYVHDLDAGM